MKNIIYILFTLFSVNVFGQQALYNKVNEVLVNKGFNSTSLDNKLTAISYYNGSVNLAKELDKTMSVYQYAKLKGGKKGIVVVMIVDNIDQQIQLEKLGYTHSIKIVKSELGDVIPDVTTVVYNSDGQVVLKDKKEGEVYTSVQQLITR